MPDRGVVAFQGRREGRSAFALVNAQWSRAFESAGYRVVDFDRGAAPPDVVIHHDFESHFTAFEPPRAGKCIAVRTWDFGPLPPVWTEKINDQFHQYWAYSRWIAAQAEAAGVEPGRIRVVPLGIDPSVFTPDGPARALATDKRFRFLFVGGVSLRKGTDLLLDAYARAFTRADDVCLVLKDHSGDLFYRENHARGRIAGLQSDPDAPEILHLDEFLPEAELAALYRSCDVAVFPYRAEGFCLPILEAMASGTPSIAPDFGACLDFCTPGTSWLVKARRIRAPVSRSFSVALGFQEVLSEVDFCELPVERLAEALRSVRDAPREALQARALAGVALARDRMTWAQSGAAARACLAELR
jgi:glycosyltransferase involved in cell wall biosynthesis